MTPMQIIKLRSDPIKKHQPPKTRPKILFLTAWYPSRVGPTMDVFMTNQAHAISKYSDIHVLFITPDPNLDKKDYEIDNAVENGIYTTRVYFKSKNLKTTAQISKENRGGAAVTVRNYLDVLFLGIKYLRGFNLGINLITKKFGKPNLIHLNVVSPRFWLVNLWLATRTLPYIVTEHFSAYIRSDENSYNKYPLLLKLIFKLTFRRASAVITVSQHLADGLQKNGLIRREVFVIPNVVEHYQDKKKSALESPKIKILTISALIDNVKNISGLIRAFGKVVERHKNIELHIIGDGPDKENLVNLTRNTGLSNYVFFHGYVPNQKLEKYFQESRFFVLNSNFETFSLVTAESLAHGVPVVVTRCGGPEEFVNKNVGILVKRGDEDDLVRGLEYMIKNHHKYDSTKITRYAKLMFSPPVVGKKIYEIYKLALKNI